MIEGCVREMAIFVSTIIKKMMLPHSSICSNLVILKVFLKNRTACTVSSVRVYLTLVTEFRVKLKDMYVGISILCTRER